MGRGSDDERSEAGEGASWTPAAPEPTHVGRPEPTVVEHNPQAQEVTQRTLVPGLMEEERTPEPGLMEEERTPEPARAPLRERERAPVPPRATDKLGDGSNRAGDGVSSQPQGGASKDPVLQGGVSDFLPTREELAPLLAAVRGAAERAWAHLRRWWLLFVERVWRPARKAALEKIRELLQEDGAAPEVDHDTDTFSRKRAKQWRKFEDGKTSSSYLQDDEAK